MLFRSFLGGLLLLLICLGLCGCYQGADSQVEDQKNPYFAAGKERLSGRDFKGAIAAFEKALELNPRSAQTHYELAMLYDNHSDQKEEDYVAAMYHYTQVMKLRPNEYPADNARERITYCKRELVKAEALAPVAQNLMHDLARLKQENQALRKQLDSCQVPPPSRLPGSTKTATNRSDRLASNSTSRSTNAPLSLAGISAAQPGGERLTHLPTIVVSSRTHTVKERETFFSIARQYRVNPETLIAANSNVDAKRLKVGQVINVPAN